jgi:hypothetical protein
MEKQHTQETCSQGPTLEYIKESIGDLKNSTKRTADALEILAAQGAMVAGLQKDVGRHESYFEEIFPRLREIENREAKESGAKEVIVEKRKFVDQVKANLSAYVVGAFFLGIFIIDKFNIAQKLSAAWKEMCK